MIYIVWIHILLLVFFWSYSIDDYMYGFLIGMLISVGFFMYLVSHGFTGEQRVENRHIEVVESQPKTTQTPVGDGCILYHYYPNGKNTGDFTKFIQCPNSSVTTETKRSCGAPKAPRTCSDSTTTLSQ